MKLSTVIELLIIFLFIAFAASRTVGGSDKGVKLKGVIKQANGTRPATSPLASCKCATLQCRCCRDFSLPVVSLKGPGCASISYLNGNSVRLTMSFGDRVLRNITLAGRKPNPVCMGLPGGISKFCGRIYGIQREGDRFRACLALELRALDDIEAALRVSCFTFGPQGVKLEPGRPIPNSNPDDEDDDDDDDDDDYGLDDDDDGDFGLDDDDDETENDVDSGELDYTGFSGLSDEFLESFFEPSGTKKKKTPIENNQKVTTVATTLAKINHTIVQKQPVTTESSQTSTSEITINKNEMTPSTTIANIASVTDTVEEIDTSIKVNIANKDEINSETEQKMSTSSPIEETSIKEADEIKLDGTRQGSVTTRRLPCNCTQGNCMCCTGYILNTFNISTNNRACINIAYQPEDFEFNYKLLFNDRVLYKSDISGKNPRPVCLPLRRFISATMCVRFTNVYMIGRNLHACVNLEAVWQKYELFKVNFDCIRIGTSGVAHVKPEEGGGIPESLPEDTLPSHEVDYSDSAR